MNLGELYRQEYGRILASLIRVIRDFDLAEASLQEAFAAALVQWPAQGPPQNPVAWLITTARHKAIDQLRRRELAERKRDDIAALVAQREDTPVPLDLLRLIFTCCHPALAPEAQVALTLRTVCGLSTEEIAHAFIVPTPTLAQRLVRAKAKIKGARIPYEVPGDDELAERLDAVLAVIYLVFNEGYAASFGAELVRADLCAEAIRLGCLLVELLPAEPEPKGLLALMLLHDARRATRTDDEGAIVLLEDQDRSRWDRAKIAEGAALVEQALRGRPPGRYAVQAAIAAPRSGSLGARDRLATDRRAVQRAGVYLPLTGRGAEPRGGDRYGRWSRARPRPIGHHPSARLSPAAGCARRSSTAPRPTHRGGRRLSSGVGVGDQRGRAAIPRAAAGRGHPPGTVTVAIGEHGEISCRSMSMSSRPVRRYRQRMSP